jgi:hypothetical protein
MKEKMSDITGERPYYNGNYSKEKTRAEEPSQKTNEALPSISSH